MAVLLENVGFNDPAVSLTSLLPTSNGAALLFEIVLTDSTDEANIETFDNSVRSGLLLVTFGQFSVDQNTPIQVVSVSSAGTCTYVYTCVRKLCYV